MGATVLIGSVELNLLVLLVIILAGPLIAARLRIPSLIGLIAGGMIVGPFVLGWIATDSLLSDFGDVGLLFLMFLAGISFDLRAFVRNRSNALVYGLLGFVIPFALSVAVAMSFSDLGILAAALIGAMWASNTLVAYPEVVAAGLQTNRGVTSAVSAGVVADLLSLTVLALASSTAVIAIEGDEFTTATTTDPAMPIWIGIPVLVAFTLWVLPKIAEWFFVNIGRTRGQRFLFCLAGMAAGATVALIGGVEGLIGAFLAGLGLNRLVPARGALMERLDFVGGTLFVPAFLVSIGLAIDPAVLFDAQTVVLALLFTGLVVVGKTIAAVVTGAVFKVSAVEIGLMASLSVGQAASTLAIAQVGIQLEFFGQDIVNAAVLTIVITAFITSVATKYFAKRVPRPPKVEAALGETVLIDTRVDGAIQMLAVMGVGAAMSRTDDGVVVPYSVAAAGEKDASSAVIDAAVLKAAEHGLDSLGRVTVDDSFTSGTLRLVEEVDASFVVLAWQGLRFGQDLVLGNEIDAVGVDCPVPAMALKALRPWERVVAIAGDLSTEWKREDAMLSIEIASRLARQRGVPLVVVTTDSPAVRGLIDEEDVEVIETRDPRRTSLDLVTSDDLAVVPAHAIQASAGIWSWRVTRTFRDVSVAVVAGPHRLSVAGGGLNDRGARSFVGPHTDAD